MPDAHPHHKQAGAVRGQATEALLAGVLAAAKAALPEGLDLLVWGAARVGDQATLRYLLANGGGSSWTPSQGNELWGCGTCLGVASWFGHEGAVKQLLEAGVDVDEGRADNRGTPLFLAAQEGHEGVAEQLLKAGADVNKAKIVGYDAVTPLHIAAQNGHEGVIEQLLKVGDDVNKATASYGDTPLHIAAENGHEGVVEQLLKAGADVNKATTKYEHTPLFIATHQSHEGVVEKLLKAGPDLDFDPDLLVYASSMGYSQICSLLLGAGANVNYASDEGTALEHAVDFGYRDIALLLIEHGASIRDEEFFPKMRKDLNKWMAEALQEKKRVITEKDRQIEAMVQGIREWCAQAASAAVADEGEME